MPKQQRPIQMLNAAQRAARTPASAITAPTQNIAGSAAEMAMVLDDFADDVIMRCSALAGRFNVDTKSVLDHVWRRVNGSA
jgi:hypothetical protein